MKASTLAQRLLRGSIVSALIALIATLMLGGLLPAHAGINDKDNDFNNDGASDLLGYDLSPSCLYRWNGNGSGSIIAGEVTGCDTVNSSLTDLMTPGDLNSDGDADIATISTSTGGSCLLVRRGDGAGHFGAYNQIGCGWSPYQGSITGIGDLNGDGDGDLVGVNNSGCMFHWLGIGDAIGSFESGVQMSCGWTPYRFSLAAPGDLNGDGDTDLVAINSSTGCLFRWIGFGNGTLGSGTQIGCGWAPYQGQLAGMGDLNGDGDGDLIGINRNTNCLFRWLGDGAGGFGSGVQLGCTGWSDKYLAR